MPGEDHCSHQEKDRVKQGSDHSEAQESGPEQKEIEEFLCLAKAEEKEYGKQDKEGLNKGVIQKIFIEDERWIEHKNYGYHKCKKRSYFKGYKSPVEKKRY